MRLSLAILARCVAVPKFAHWFVQNHLSRNTLEPELLPLLKDRETTQRILGLTLLSCCAIYPPSPVTSPPTSHPIVGSLVRISSDGSEAPSVRACALRSLSLAVANNDIDRPEIDTSEQRAGTLAASLISLEMRILREVFPLVPTHTDEAAAPVVSFGLASASVQLLLAQSLAEPLILAEQLLETKLLPALVLHLPQLARAIDSNAISISGANDVRPLLKVLP